MLESILRHPRVKKEIISGVGLATGFAARKLFTTFLRRSVMGLAGLGIEMLIIFWISRHPEWVDYWIDKLTGKNKEKNQPSTV